MRGPKESIEMKMLEQGGNALESRHLREQDDSSGVMERIEQGMGLRVGRVPEEDQDALALRGLVSEQVQRWKTRVTQQVVLAGETLGVVDGSSEEVVGGRETVADIPRANPPCGGAPKYG